MRALLVLPNIIFVGGNDRVYVYDFDTRTSFELESSCLGKVLCLSYDQNAGLLYGAGGNKRIVCWNILSKTLISQSDLHKVPTSLFVSNWFDESCKVSRSLLLVSDKASDIWAIDCNKLDNKLLLGGHTSSVITDMIKLRNNMVITCDRDEKIRVSHFPSMIQIQSYCIGHSSVVTSLCELSHHDRHYFVSSSFDGKIILWEPLTGSMLDEFSCDASKDEYATNEFADDPLKKRKIAEDEKESAIEEGQYMPLKVAFFPSISAVGILFRHSQSLLFVSVDFSRLKEVDNGTLRSVTQNALANPNFEDSAITNDMIETNAITDHGTAGIFGPTVHHSFNDAIPCDIGEINDGHIAVLLSNPSSFQILNVSRVGDSYDSLRIEKIQNYQSNGLISSIYDDFIASFESFCQTRGMCS
jgi:hypothetical protein